MTEIVTYRTDNDILYIGLNGRVDASNAPEVEKKIMQIREENPGKIVVIDADNLQYISSAGLRIMLRLRKLEPDLQIINVISEVYEVFEMTGFTEMISVKKAFRKISVEGCEVIGRGANGAVYRYDPETIVKIYHNPDSLPEIQNERELARKAFVHGVNTAIPYDIVRVGDGYGTVMELLAAKSVSKLIKADPKHLDIPVKYYVDMLKTIHSVELEPEEMPDMKKVALGWAKFDADYLTEEQGKKLVKLIEEVPQRNTMLHGDYHTNNLMIREGEALLIDMDTLCMGHPIFELGSMYNAYLGFAAIDHSIVENFLGITYETAGRFWRLALSKYLDTDDSAVIDSVEEKAMLIGYTRLLRRSLRRNEPNKEAFVKHCKKELSRLIEKIDTLEFAV